MKRGYVDTPAGQVHYVSEGEGEPLLLLHHTPRSWTFYRSVIPLLSSRRRVIAMDTLGFGASDPPPADFGPADLAGNVVDVLDALGVDRSGIVGAMTGARLALEVAFTSPERVTALVLLAPPFFPDEQARSRRLNDSRTEAMGAPEPDGAHVVRLWRYVLDNLAAIDAGTTHVPGMYVADDGSGAAMQSPIPELTPVQLEYLHDWMIDTLRCGDLWPRTAKAVYSNDLRDRLRALDVPTLVVGMTGLGFPPFIRSENARRVQALIPGSRFAEIDAPTADSRVTAFHASEVASLIDGFV